MTLDSATLHDSRLVTARTVLDAPVLATDLLADLRHRWSAEDAWDAADERYDDLSDGERVVYGWLRAHVWHDTYDTSFQMVDALHWCGDDDESKRAIADAARVFLELGCAEYGVSA